MYAVNQLCNLLNTENILSHSDEVTRTVQPLRNAEKCGFFLGLHTIITVARESEQSLLFNHPFCQSDTSRYNMLKCFKFYP